MQNVFSFIKANEHSVICVDTCMMDILYNHMKCTTLGVRACTRQQFTGRMGKYR